VPTLAEVLEVCRGRIRLHLELKGKGTAGPAVRTVKEMGMADQVVFTCFNPDRLIAVRELDASLPVSLNVGERDPKIWQKAERAGAGSVGVRWTALTPEMVTEAHGRGLEIGGWNPDTDDEWRAVAGLGLDLICTNHPEGLIPFLRDAGLHG
jgi:glycerophosphoryl diester phosphodiesterase